MADKHALPRKLPALPPPPEKPDPLDCCGSGCVPCIFDVYETALEAWREEVARLRAEHDQETDV